MNNTMTIDGHIATIEFDPDIHQFRGEFTGLAGGADFYADNVDALAREGSQSLQTFLAVCRERGIEPYKQFSGKFMIRVPADMHARFTAAAKAQHVSLNRWVAQALEREVRD